MLYLGPSDLSALAIETADLLSAVRQGIEADATGLGTAEPTYGYGAYDNPHGALYCVRGTHAGLGLASAKLVGAFPTNRARGWPPDPGLMALFKLENGEPVAILDASFVTQWRTAALVACAGIGLGRSSSKVLACIGTRGIAPLAAELLHAHYNFSEIRFFSATEESRRAAVERFSSKVDLVWGASSWEDCIAGSDIVIDGAALTSHRPLFPVQAVGEGQTILVFGAYSSLTPQILPKIDCTFTDRWVPGDTGISGAAGPLIASKAITESSLTGYLGHVQVGRGDGRTGDQQTILVWLRGLAPCDVTLGHHLVEKAQQQNIGTTLAYL